MRWYSYVPEEDAEEGAVFAPTIEMNFKEALKETDVVRICLAYRASLEKDSADDLVASTNASDLEVMCAYTKKSWKDQEWQIKWAKTISPKELPRFVAGTTNGNMPTYQVVVVEDIGWELEASFADKETEKTVLLDMTRW